MRMEAMRMPPSGTAGSPDVVVEGEGFEPS